MRPFDSAADAGRLAELMTATGPEPVSEADVRAWMAGENPQTVFDAVIAEHGGAYAEAYRQPWHTPGEFTGRILVAPQRRRHGLGAALLDHITDFAVRHGATALAGRVREDDADGRRFADRHGFRVRRHTFESIVDASSLDPNAMQAPDPPDVTVMTLADLGDTDEHRREIWRIHEGSFADEPSRTEAARRSYEHFTSQLFETGWWRPETQFVALAGGSWAGVAVLRLRPQTNSFYTFYTGVDRPFRGRGIASALKRATIRYALGAGAAFLTTSNDSANAPMLAVNRRFGFRPLPGVLQVVREIGCRPALSDHSGT